MVNVEGYTGDVSLEELVRDTLEKYLPGYSMEVIDNALKEIVDHAKGKSPEDVEWFQSLILEVMSNLKKRDNLS